MPGTPVIYHRLRQANRTSYEVIVIQQHAEIRDEDNDINNICLTLLSHSHFPGVQRNIHLFLRGMSRCLCTDPHPRLRNVIFSESRERNQLFLERRLVMFENAFSLTGVCFSKRI